MSLRTDGKYLWAQVKWSVGGTVADPKKVMFVDSGQPHSEISFSNYRKNLKIIGKGAKRGHHSYCLILDGGTIFLDGRTCSWPVWYCPESNRDVLGCDQFTTLGIIPGVATRSPATSFATLRIPLSGIPAEFLEEETGATPRPPGPGPFPTPPPNLFSLGSTPKIQGVLAEDSWRYVHGWPAFIAPGEVFSVIVKFIARTPIEALAITHEIPFGFDLVDGGSSTVLTNVGATETHWRTIRLRASRDPGDHYWHTSVRFVTESHASTRDIHGRLMVRSQVP